MTTFAIEMHMLVVIMLMITMTMTKFIAHAIATIFNDVYQMVLTEKSQRSKYARFVN